MAVILWQLFIFPMGLMLSWNTVAKWDHGSPRCSPGALPGGPLFPRCPRWFRPAAFLPRAGWEVSGGRGGGGGRLFSTGLSLVRGGWRPAPAEVPNMLWHIFSDGLNSGVSEEDWVNPSGGGLEGRMEVWRDRSYIIFLVLALGNGLGKKRRKCFWYVTEIFLDPFNKNK